MRGFSAVSLLIIDEASRVSDAMYRALRPMLAVGNGDLWLMSTPYGQRGFFYQTWENGGAEWMRVRVPATECPRISQRFLEEERSVMGDVWFRQEHLCEFVEDGARVFDRDVDRESGGRGSGGTGCFYVGLDLGQKRDHTAIAVVEGEAAGICWSGIWNG